MVDKYLYVYKVELVRVIDGDTVIVTIDLGFDVKITRTIRLADIDTPELKGETEKEQQAAEIARVKLFRELANKEIFLCSMKIKKDMYNRYLGVLYSDSYNINEKLLEEGYAKEYKNCKPKWYEKDFDKIIQIGG